MFKLFCTFCKQPTEPNEDYASTCCYEPLMTEAGADVNADMIFEYLDATREYYEEEGLKRNR